MHSSMFVFLSQMLNPPMLELLGHQLPQVEQQDTNSPSSRRAAELQSSVAQEGLLLSSARTLLAFAHRRRYDKYLMSFKLPGAGGGLDWVPVMYHLNIEYMPTMRPYAINVAVQVAMTPLYRSLSSFASEQPFTAVRAEVRLQMAGIDDGEAAPSSARAPTALELDLGLARPSSPQKHQGIRGQAMAALMAFQPPSCHASHPANKALQAEQNSHRFTQASRSAVASTHAYERAAAAHSQWPLGTNSLLCNTPSRPHIELLEGSDCDSDDASDAMLARSTFSSPSLEDARGTSGEHSAGHADDGELEQDPVGLQRTSSSQRQGSLHSFSVVPSSNSVQVTLMPLFPAASAAHGALASDPLTPRLACANVELDNQALRSSPISFAGFQGLDAAPGMSAGAMSGVSPACVHQRCLGVNPAPAAAAGSSAQVLRPSGLPPVES